MLLLIVILGKYLVKLDVYKNLFYSIILRFERSDKCEGMKSVWNKNNLLNVFKILVSFVKVLLLMY